MEIKKIISYFYKLYGRSNSKKFMANNEEEIRKFNLAIKELEESIAVYKINLSAIENELNTRMNYVKQLQENLIFLKCSDAIVSSEEYRTIKNTLLSIKEIIVRLNKQRNDINKAYSEEEKKLHNTKKQLENLVNPNNIIHVVFGRKNGQTRN